MTTPAVSYWDSVSSTYYYTLTVSGSVWDAYWATCPGASSGYRVRPASVSSPLRPDKTRAPMAWTHFGASVRGCHGEVRTSSGSYHWRAIGDFTSIDAHDWALTFVDGSVQTIVKQQAELKALSTFTDRVEQLNEALRQVGSTARMFATFTKGFAHELDNLWDSLKRDGLAGDSEKLSDFLSSSAKRNWKGIPDHYLAGLYGLAPLGDDISNAFDKLADDRALGLSMSVLLKGKHKLVREVPTPNIGVGPNFWVNAVQRQTYKAECTLRYDLPAWWFDELPPVAPFSTEWAMRPYSFVIDWALPIGQWLMAVEAAQLAPFFVEGSTSVTVRSQMTKVETMSYYQLDYDSVKFTGSAFRFNRYAYSTVSGPPSALLMAPQLKSALSYSHVAQGLALLTQALRG